jgi:hypothetical protein
MQISLHVIIIIGRALGTLSPPTITQSIPFRSSLPNALIRVLHDVFELSEGGDFNHKTSYEARSRHFCQTRVGR